MNAILRQLTPAIRGAYSCAIMKKIVGSLCVLICITCFAQSPNAKVLVLEKEQGEKRVRPAGVGIATLPVELLLVLGFQELTGAEGVSCG